MFTQTCINCKVDKPLEEFTMRKRPPIQPYAACKKCERVAYSKPRPKSSYYEEMKILRDKAKQMRKLTPDQDAMVYQRVSKGETRKAIAEELGVSQTVVGKAYKRGYSLDRLK